MRKSAPARFGSIATRSPLVGARQRIGLVGGSFNPPHMAHRIITQVALKRLGLDRVWWLVTPGNPLKSRSELAPLDVRVRLAAAMADDPRIISTDLEKTLPSTFSAATLAHLVLRNPEVRLVWVMGADCLASFHRWKHWRDIFRLVPVAVVDRPGWRHRALASPAAQAFAARRLPESRARRLVFREPPCWTLLTGPLMSISSTQLRAERRAAASRTAPVTGAVANAEDQALKVGAASSYPDRDRSVPSPDEYLPHSLMSRQASSAPFRASPHGLDDGQEPQPKMRTATGAAQQSVPHSEAVSAGRASETLLKRILAWLDDAKAEDIVTIDLKGKSSIGDFMIIASGRSDRHVGAIGDQVQRKLKDEGHGRVRIEGMPQCDWVLIDTGDIILHIFRPEVREFYNLEKMWAADRTPDVTAH
ncbi:MAG: nicotinate-nucleotide adenylyltransferase [Hyphomicrobiaceae bacterium]|nr:nicotinate-nucleotide adenylyltransferase [Hyphomicrobiaceae bacterium]